MNRSSELTVQRVARKREGVCLFESTAIAGTRHIADIEQLAGGYRPQARFTLERDRGNLFDDWAVRVLDEDRNQLGYVSCECNEVVARLIDGGKRVSARFRGLSQRGRWTRIEMGVYLDD